MLKQISLSLAAIALLASCSVKEERLDCSAPVTVSVSGFNVSQEPFTKATSVASYDGVKHITLAFYNTSGTEVFKKTQNKESMPTGETFGEFTTSLPLGNYTMVVIANGGSNIPTLSGATEASYGENVVGDTFATSQAVNINSLDAVNLTATLDRIVAFLAVNSTDGRIEQAKKIRITTTTGSRSFNPTTGLATVNSGIIANITQPEAVGTVTRSAVLLFLASDEQSADVTLEILDADDQVLVQKTVTNVPLKRNRRTILSGALYSATASSGSFQVNNEWLSNYNQNF
ncbi:MAG: FimB/Mfa2 family fimbrial subunit [Bacteroidales bacterium]|nr:FimB/Mfa2 family fimbrial subunit [Bacteroidales bacterium]